LAVRTRRQRRACGARARALRTQSCASGAQRWRFVNVSCTAGPAAVAPQAPWWCVCGACCRPMGHGRSAHRAGARCGKLCNQLLKPSGALLARAVQGLQWRVRRFEW